MNTTAESSATRTVLSVLLVGVAAGVLAGVTMLVTMGILRLAFGSLPARRRLRRSGRSISWANIHSISG
jgi:hypothetical protein